MAENIEQLENNVVCEPAAVNCSKLLEVEGKEHAVIGISPFNSYYSEQRIASLIRWGIVNEKFNQLIVRDTATGIPKKYLAKIFDQYETKKTTSGGTGLGLAFCKMVMESYGGSITCNSELGKYTEFVLNFPKIKCPMN